MADNLQRKVRKRSGKHSTANSNPKRTKQGGSWTNIHNPEIRSLGNEPGEVQNSGTASCVQLPSTPAKSPQRIRQIQCKKPLFRNRRQLVTEGSSKPDVAQGSDQQDVFRELATGSDPQDILHDRVTSTPVSQGSKTKLKQPLESLTASPIADKDAGTDAVGETNEAGCGKFAADGNEEVHVEEEWGFDDSSLYANIDLSNIVSGALNSGKELCNHKEVCEELEDVAVQELQKCSKIAENNSNRHEGQCCALDFTEVDGARRGVSHSRRRQCNRNDGRETTVSAVSSSSQDIKTNRDPTSRQFSEGRDDNDLRNQKTHGNRKTSIMGDDTESDSVRPADIDKAGCSAGGVCGKTPQTVLSIKERIKQRLQNNAKTSTPKLNKCQELKRAEVEKAINIDREMENKAMDKDVGPFYGLPSKVKELLRTQRGINQLYDWQNSCLTLPAVLESRNLIYSLPTSGGKTLVAEILIMQQLLCHKKDAMLILPFVSIVQEKVRSLSPFAVELGFLVEEYAASKGAMPPRKRRKKQTIYIATIEKAHSLVNCLIQERRIGDVGLVVVDELHMLGEGGRRGATLEMTLTKLMYTKSAQIIGMSATLNNISDLQEFLQAEIYTSNFRPVELTEYVKIDDNIFQINQKALCPDEKFVHARTVLFPYKTGMLKEDPDHLAGLVMEVIPDHSCLIFCATKKNCQNVAELLCRLLTKTLTEHKQKEKKELLAALRRDSENNICPTLRRTVPYGIAYHHSGLTMDERKLIEDAYSDGTLCLLTCTSTLAAGVNLPAKRVILRSPYIANQLLTSSKYKQMVGRAGRAGIDTSGESILIIKHKEKQQVLEILSNPVENCRSSLLYEDGKGMRSLVLSITALQLTHSREEVLNFMKHTLCQIQSLWSDEADIGMQATDAISQLTKLGLVKEKPRKDSPSNKILETTKLGHAAFKGSLDIDACPSIYQDLQRAAENGLVVTNTLHLLFLVTPRDMDAHIKIDWMYYYNEYLGLGEAEMATASVIGVTESYLVRKAAGYCIRQDKTNPVIVERFYLTLMLWLVLKEHSIWSVAEIFQVPRGFIQSLFSSAATFAASLQRFTEELPEFWAFQHLLGQIVKELSYCATADLVPLLEIPGVKQGRARQLLKAGFKTLQQLAYTTPEHLVETIEHMSHKLARQIVSAAKMELEERAEALREQADEMMENQPEQQKS